MMRVITTRSRRRFGVLSALVLSLLIACGIPSRLSASEPERASANPGAWTITKDMLFTADNKPRTEEVAQLLVKLEAKHGQGTRVSRKEFLALLKRPQARVVYADILLRYATPRSLENQTKAHVDLAKQLLTEKNQQACIAFLKKQKKYLRRAEERYHVKQQDIVGILTWESGLGKFTGNYRIFNVFLSQILLLDAAQEASVRQIVEKGEPDPLLDPVIAAREKRRFQLRKADAVNSLAALLRTAKKMKFDPLTVLGSWGGASGYVQFMPYNIQYAVDADGNGLNLKTWPDAIYSVANFLKVQGNYKGDAAGRKNALLRYNRNEAYADGIIALADTIWQRYQHPTAPPPGAR